MTDRDPSREQSDELQQLRAQLAELTRRVYQLEGIVGPRASEIAPAASAPLPAVERPAEAESRPSILSQATPAATTPLPIATTRQAIRAQPSASLESRVGGQWLNRIGIVALLVGLSYFLKLAFENDWIGPATQVLIGLGAGIALLLWSERFRGKGYTGFAYSLKAVGVGALYLSLWAAAQYYHLVPPSVTFIGMVIVTVTSAALSLRQNAELLAAFALAGGLLTPVLISTGENHETALFCYLALLDLGTIWVTAIKSWQRLLLGAYIGTALLYAAWASSYYTEAQLATTLGFATLFFLLFVIASLLDGAKPTSHAQQNVIVALVLLNASGYFAASYLMLADHYRSELAWLAVCLAILFVVLTRVIQKRHATDASVVAPLHLAVGVGFLSVALPLKAEGYWLALGWLIEAGALFWAAHRASSRLLRLLGVAALALGVVQLVAIDSDAQQPLIFNPRFGLYLVAIAALALLVHNLLAEDGESNRAWAAGAVLAINLLALIALHFEVMNYFQPGARQILTPSEWRGLRIMRDFTYSAVWMIYGSALMLVGFWKRSAFLRWQAIVLLAVTAAKVFFYDIAALERGYRIAAFIVLGTILLAVSFFYQRSRIKVAD